MAGASLNLLRVNSARLLAAGEAAATGGSSERTVEQRGERGDIQMSD